MMEVPGCFCPQEITLDLFKCLSPQMSISIYFFFKAKIFLKLHLRPFIENGRKMESSILLNHGPRKYTIKLLT